MATFNCIECYEQLNKKNYLIKKSLYLLFKKLKIWIEIVHITHCSPGSAPPCQWRCKLILNLDKLKLKITVPDASVKFNVSLSIYQMYSGQ